MSQEAVETSPELPAVPFVDLRAVTRPVQAAILAEIERLMERGSFINGPAVDEFEHEFSTWCGHPYCVGVASGLDGLRLSLGALGVGPGDEVIVPAMTFIATFEAVAQVGAAPVPADVNPDDVGLNPDAVAAAITRRTKAIVPVHLYGQMADMNSLRRLAAVHDLAVVEDAAQAHGAVRDGLRAGSAGHAGAFSFYPSKNLGAMGDAGAVVTDDTEVAARVRALREHGQTGRYRSDFVGYTARLDAFQATVLTHKLPLLDGWNESRRHAASVYTNELAGAGDLLLPREVPGARHVWHLYTVRTADPQALAEHLSADGISTGRHYPEPPHLSQAFASLGHRPGAFPIAEVIGRETLSLPIFPHITSAQQARVVSAVKAFFSRG